MSVARLNPDGTLDASFKAAVDSSQDIAHLALLPDGKMIIAGRSYPIGSTKQLPNIARLHPDGSLDTSFVPPAPPPVTERYDVSAMAVQTDGMIIIATNYSPATGGTIRPTLTRLNPNGSIEGGFAPEVSSVYMKTILPLPDGKVLLGGFSGYINGEYFSGLTRLHNTWASKPKLSLSFNADSVVWSRGNTTSEVQRVTFELSTDGVNYGLLGYGRLGATGWTLGGLKLPAGIIFIRARGFSSTAGSGSIFETSREFGVMGRWSEDADPQPSER